ncbi:DUF1653 domain-containing protein [Deinococcus peraridilitoris]|uniref:DUF1653 domain-containing protein n=1 Tax=Deinococcus peraridilitoris (strain DSM 19664 / LMG 22246 / CIP 109416 / KR-200) TaxID=937777 RepID=K9ZXX9_DEIPD|nr:DUF1653 domain-containing protein [Deinococcus peraridilitoris]AFZ66049.1 Protein of unknown function (DUF1653) [Deinococcus peraridilitoris DSM 19664]
MKGHGPHPLWRHKKTGGIYEEIARGRLEHDETPVVVYRHCLKAEVWVRPEAEFMDGRFEPLG